MLQAATLFLSELPWNIKAKDIGVPTSTSTVSGGFSNVISLMIAAIGMLAIVFIIVGGIQYAYSMGNAKRTQQARETITYAVVGLVLAIAAYAIVAFASDAFGG